MMRSARRGVVIPLLLLASWEIAFLGQPPSDSLAPPSAVVRAGATALADGSLVVATWETLSVVVSGLLLGGGAGMVAGIVLGLVPALARLARAPVEALRPLPSVALIPLALLVFGFGPAMGASVVAFATFWPMLVLSQGAVGGVDRTLRDVTRALQLGPVARVAKVILPAALPRLVVALRLAVGVALVVAVTVEIAANPQGLGYSLTMAQQGLAPALALAYLVWIGVLGWGLNRILVAAERRLLLHHGQAGGGR
ncbi:ABC transporter permease subunit [Roseomonas sp. KE2513]|uniref:ABC transporter permease n=1 Tax=Roseomonas sp. KE2513 TaxID=2479202 RepID=UPI0018DFC6DB|nr:ABC transporter permease subunit [Roseomonas sp. KE2513]MBI0538788.1 ABC transporter permease subunit [Roseomonas sp. KE2513]